MQFAVAKIGKYATSESGDTLEMIERPSGGLSFVLADGQRSGLSAKLISNIVARKAIQLLSEGVRDGAAARAAHDYLYAQRGGKVSATLNILSIDLVSKTFVISRNNAAPVLVYTQADGHMLLDQPSKSVGVNRNTKPVIAELPLLVGTIIVVFTDGLRHAGDWSGQGGYDPEATFREMIAAGITSPRTIADSLMAGALAKDNGRPKDDISVLVTAVLPPVHSTKIRRMDVHLPL
ncbi:MAG: serine/threonine-protein phosphatase [Ardenticatenaceae bacterium]|nr:serine/threonine-protein phosphatase [Ardenticatenaceae bacterium]